jgi:nucleoid-associated protein YgaU
VLLAGLVGATLFRRRPGTDVEPVAPAAAGPQDSTAERPPPAGAAPRALGRIDLNEQAGEMAPDDASRHHPAAALDPAWTPDDEPAEASEGAGRRPPFETSSWHGAGGDESTARAGEPPAAAGSSFRHTIRDGDTLSSIARRYLGSSERFLEIFEANRHRLASPDLLPIGVQLDIPPAGAGAAARPEQPSEPASQRHTATAGDMVAIPPGSLARGEAAGNSPRTYLVRADDTLAEIARRFYGDGRRYRELFEANRDRLASPDDLREGTMLVIPYAD